MIKLNLKNRLVLSLESTVVGQLIRFAVVGLSGVFLDLGAFYLFHNSLDLALTPSAMLSTEVAIVNNFVWNDLWTFGDVSTQQQLNAQRVQRFFRFNLICFFGLILNSLIMNLLLYRFEVNEYIAKLVAIACVALWNFWLNLKVNWQVTKTEVYVVGDGG